MGAEQPFQIGVKFTDAQLCSGGRFVGYGDLRDGFANSGKFIEGLQFAIVAILLRQDP